MRKDEALERLRSHLDDLAQFDVKSIAIFGSVARDEATPSSDIDILIDFYHPATFSNFFDLKYFLESVLDLRVDIITTDSLKSHLAQPIADDLNHIK